MGFLSKEPVVAEVFVKQQTTCTYRVEEEQLKEAINDYLKKKGHVIPVGRSVLSAFSGYMSGPSVTLTVVW